MSRGTKLHSRDRSMPALARQTSTQSMMPLRCSPQIAGGRADHRGTAPWRQQRLQFSAAAQNLSASTPSSWSAARAHGTRRAMSARWFASSGRSPRIVAVQRTQRARQIE